LANPLGGTFSLRIERVDGSLHATLQLIDMSGLVVAESVDQLLHILNKRV
jgi:hypothetical protein